MSTGTARDSKNTGGTTRSTGQGKARLDKRQLNEAVESLLSHSVSASTLRTYKAGGRRFAEFRAGLGESLLPALEAHLCEFVAQLEADGLTHGTMKSYLAAVRHFHIRNGWGDPRMGDMPRLVQALQGVKRKRAEQGGTTWIRLPITVYLLEKMRVVWSQEGSDDSRMLFFGFMWSGEITVPEGATFDSSTHLRIQDVAVDRKAEPQMVQITL